jgi:hypothetical protein
MGGPVNLLPFLPHALIGAAIDERSASDFADGMT